MSTKIPFKPYLLRAFHQWLNELGETPQILVDCSVGGVNVPTSYIKDNRIILNISYSAAHNLFISDSEITFGSRFGNNQMQVKVPMEAVLAVYSRESGDSIPFITTKDVKAERVKAENEDSSGNPFPEPQVNPAADPIARNFLHPDSPKMAPEPPPMNQTKPLQGGIKKGELTAVFAKPTRDTSHLRVIK
jgi:stringent starvation protein B